MRNTMMIAVLAATVSLAGCAMGTTKVAEVQPEPQLRGYDAEIDWGYVAKVNKIAERRGVKIVWVHYPPRKQDIAQNR